MVSAQTGHDFVSLNDAGSVPEAQLLTDVHVPLEW